MEKISKKIVCIVLISMLILVGMRSQVAYAKTEAEELKELFDEYEDNLGNLDDLKGVMDQLYKDLKSATKVDDTLKETLKKDVENLNNVQDMNPLVLSVLSIQLNSQIDNLTDENLGEMQEEISVIKQWVDEKVGSQDDNNNSNNNNNGNNNSGNDANNGNNNANNSNGSNNNQSKPSVDNTIANTNIPKAGVKYAVTMLFIIMLVGSIMFVKYRKLQDIK